jgi:hypothetical protein
MGVLPIAVVVLAVSGFPQRIEDSKHGFSFVAPPGYQQGAATMGAGSLYTFVRGQPGAGSWGVFSIAPLGGTLAEGSKVNHAIAEAAAREEASKSGVDISAFEYRVVQWAGFPLDVMVSRASGGDQHVVTSAVQIPLAAGALQIQFVGGDADEAQLTADLNALVGSLQGKTNWQTEADRDRALGEKVGFLAGLAIIPLAGIAVGVFLLLRARKRR